jgi:predicted RNase H-like nuclease
MAVLERSVSAQLVGILSKIAEVDAFLLASVEARSVFHEIHPELCFCGLAGGSPMKHAKRSAAGLAERLRLLKRYAPTVHQLLRRVVREQPRKHIARDDVLDATVAWLTARAPRTALRQMRGDPPVDELGLPIDIQYPTPY